MARALYHSFRNHAFLIWKPWNHVTVIAKNAWEFPRGIISCNSIPQENKETVTVMLINSEEPWKL